MRRALDGYTDSDQPTYAEYFLALTEHQLGNTEAAHRYREANEGKLANLPDEDRVWQQMKTHELLQNEVRETLGADAAQLNTD